MEIKDLVNPSLLLSEDFWVCDRCVSGPSDKCAESTAVAKKKTSVTSKEKVDKGVN